MPTGPEGTQAGEVGPARGPTLAATQAEGTPTTTCLVPILLPKAIGGRTGTADGAGPPQATQAKAGPTTKVLRRSGTTRGPTQRLRLPLVGLPATPGLPKVNRA